MEHHVVHWGSKWNRAIEYLSELANHNAGKISQYAGLPQAK